MTPNVIIQTLNEKAENNRKVISIPFKNNQGMYLKTEQYVNLLEGATYAVTHDYIAERLTKIAKELQVAIDIDVDSFNEIFQQIKRQEISVLLDEFKLSTPSPRAKGRAIVVEILNDIRVTKE